MSFLDEYAEYQAQHGSPDRIELLLCDINAILRGKWMPGGDASKLHQGQVRLPISTYTPNILGQELDETGIGAIAGDPDGVIRPLPGTLKPVPWAKSNVAQVQVEMDAPTPEFEGLSTRGMLADIVARFEARGLKPVLATELEFYLFQPRGSAAETPRPPTFAPSAQNYEIDVLDRQAAILSEIQSASAAQGLATDTLIAEFGPGQFEINFHHTDDVLAAADTALLFRRLVRGVASKHGLEASFMAKPYADHPGNGMHVHVSVTGEAGNIFSAETGLADPLKQAIAGLLDVMPVSQLLFAPHLNSYRRFGPGSFSPNRPDWGLDHRGAAIRLPETKGAGARLEHRIGGADVNPYLALAAVLGGILHGLDSTPSLPRPLDDPNTTPAAPLAHDWRTAVDHFATSRFTEHLLGKRFRDLLTTIKYDEVAKISAPISPIEYRTYLGRL